MEHTPQQSSDGMVVVRVLSAVLDRLVNSNAHLVASNSAGPVTKFHALKTPGISILQYLERIQKYACCSTECFILALIYIDRLIQRNNFILTELNAHRVVITAILLAAKFFDDAYYNNAYYAKVGGVLISEMNGLEVEFLFRINFSLHVKPDVFMKYQAELVSHALGAGLEEPTITTDLGKLQYPQSADSICANDDGSSSIPPSPEPTTSHSSDSSHASMTYHNDLVSSTIVHPTTSVQNPIETQQQQQQHNQQQYQQSRGPQSMINEVVPQQVMSTTESSIEPNMFNRHITPSPSPNGGGGHIVHNPTGQEIQEQRITLNNISHQQQQGNNLVIQAPDETVYYNHQSNINPQQQAEPIPIIQRFNSYPIENQLNPSSHIMSCEQPIKSCSHVEYLNSTTSPYDQSHQAIQLNHTIYLTPNTNVPYQQQQYQPNLINNNVTSPIGAPTRKMGIVSSACSQFGRRQVYPTPNTSSPQYIEATASRGGGGGIFYRSS